MVENLAFIDARIQSAHNLLSATHAYIKWQAPIEVEHMEQEDIYKVSCEAMRVTVRMTQIIAWLMLQKAVLEGEISRKLILSEKYRVLKGNTCVESDSEEDLTLPPRLRELLKESRNLYARVLRLDESTRKRIFIPTQMEKKPLKVVYPQLN